jgi:DNA-directed RNA polymerase specialized sigma24 family protein
MGGIFVNMTDLAPLLKGTWRGTRPAFDCLLLQARLIGRAIRFVHNRSGGSNCPGFPEIEDLEHETLAVLVSGAQQDRGLLPPKNASPEQDLTPWLFRVVQNQARDIVRRGTALRRGGRFAHVPIEGEYDLGTMGEQEGTDTRHDSDRLLALVDQIIEQGSPPTHALAWVLLHYPAKLRRSLVERASVRDPRGRLDTVHGLAREPTETMAKLVEWAKEHQADPAGDGSRRVLAWILRSTSTETAEAWRQGDPEGARKARDTLRKWENRFQQRLQVLLGEQQEPAGEEEG